MRRTRRSSPARGITVATLAALLLLTPACDTDDPGPPVERDLPEIEADTLVALVTYNSTGYFIYRGRPMGFEYDILRKFAEERDLVLRTRVVRDRSRLFHLLNDGEGDVVAARVVPSERDTGHVAYTRPIYTTRAALVQRTGPADSANLPEPVDTILDMEERAERPERTEPVQIQARLVRRPAELGGQEVHMPHHTFYEDRLVELSDSIGEDVHVVEVDSASHETLIRELARGEIQFTVSPENVAQLRESYFANITVQPTLGPSHDVVFAVRTNADALLQGLNAFIADAEAEGLLREKYQQYFVDRQGFQERVASEYLTSETGRLSEYDDLLKQNARKIGWDWRLLASQTFQESLFKPRARSWAGAMGLLQLMPGTAREVGVSDPYDPEQNVAGAVRYLDKLRTQWQDDIPDEDQRLRFILASYNAGAGHVGDARRLAEKNGDDPNDWGEVAYWMLQKSKRQYYTDPVVKYGYARGLEPVTYVELILERFDHYKQFVR